MLVVAWFAVVIGLSGTVIVECQCESFASPGRAGRGHVGDYDADFERDPLSNGGQPQKNLGGRKNMKSGVS